MYIIFYNCPVRKYFKQVESVLQEYSICIEELSRQKLDKTF